MPPHVYVVYYGNDYVEYETLIRSYSLKEDAIDFVSQKIEQLSNGRIDAKDVKKKFNQLYEHYDPHPKVVYYSSDDYTFSKFMGIDRVFLDVGVE